jgi:hypothetical protein
LEILLLPFLSVAAIRSVFNEEPSQSALNLERFADLQELFSEEPQDEARVLDPLAVSSALLGSESGAFHSFLRFSFGFVSF